MSIASEITRINNNISDAYTAAYGKGATLPLTQNSANLATTIGTISTVNNTTLSVPPTTSAQTFTPSSPYTGYGEVNISAVTAAIDSNIQAGNIKSGVTILGTTGNVVELAGETQSVSLTNSAGQTFTPGNGKNGITSITVTPTNEARTVTPTTSQQTLSVNSGYSGNGTITVNAVTSSIDNNITAGNIKDGVSILGVTGTYTGGGGGSFTGLPRAVENGIYCIPTSAFTWSLPAGAVATTSLKGAFSSSGITSADMSSLQTITLGNCLDNTFKSCSGLTTLNLSGLTTISGYEAMKNMCYACSNLTSVNLSSLTSLSGGYDLTTAFASCTHLTSIDLSSLSSVTGVSALKETFKSCTRLESVDLSSLEVVTAASSFNYTFRSCVALKTLSFPSLMVNSFGSNYNNQFNYMLTGTSDCVVHFPSNMSTVINGLLGASSGFDGTNTTLLFDLPPTATEDVEEEMG